MTASWWFPETDAGVAVQVIVTLLIGIVIGIAVRREQALVLLVVGITTVTLGWYGIRGLHETGAVTDQRPLREQLAELTLPRQVELLSGASFWATEAIPELITGRRH